MKKFVIVAAALMVAGFSQVASADEYSDCIEKCSATYSACVDKAEQHVNDIEIQDAKAECEKAVQPCNTVCSDAEKAGREGVKPSLDPNENR